MGSYKEYILNMPRFTEIIKNLRIARLLQLQESQKKRSVKGTGTKKKKATKKLIFDNPQLQKLFDTMPEDCKDLIRKGK